MSPSLVQSQSVDGASIAMTGNLNFSRFSRKQMQAVRNAPSFKQSMHFRCRHFPSPHWPFRMLDWVKMQKACRDWILGHTVVIRVLLLPCLCCYAIQITSAISRWWRNMSKFHHTFKTSRAVNLPFRKKCPSEVARLRETAIESLYISLMRVRCWYWVTFESWGQWESRLGCFASNGMEKGQLEKHSCKSSANGVKTLSSTKYIETQCVFSRNLSMSLLTKRQV